MEAKSRFENNIGFLLLFMIIAYLFSMGVRMYWPIHFSDVDMMFYAGELMINTNDGYFFSTGARDIINGVVAEDAQRASAFNASPGLVLLTAYVVKFLPFSLDTVSLYLSAIISSLIVIPIILTGRLLGNTLLGFLAALIGSIAWSYYNRTMVGYYDTDMFAVFLQFTIFYSFMEIVYKKTLKSVMIATFLVLIYPYFYPQGILIVYSMFVLLVLYMFVEYKGWIRTNETNAFKHNTISMYAVVILLSISLMIAIAIEIRILLLLVAIFTLLKIRLEEKQLLVISLLFFIGFLFFGNVFAVILSKVITYADRGLMEGSLKFYEVVQTVREAGAIPFETMANRISGSQIGVIASLIGYLFLVFRHKQFIIALPLIGIGIFALVGGLRFTVYAVPIAALSFVYLSFVVGDWLFKGNKLARYMFPVVATIAMLYPNIVHVIGYKVPTVFTKQEVEVLNKLNTISDEKDYTLTWWDYGYPIWYYSNTNTLIDGGKHGQDNFIISKILTTTSPTQAANLARVAVETYVDSNYSIVANTLFKNGQKDQIDPNDYLERLESDEFKLPEASRDVFIYLPNRMLNIFPTVAIFSNINLITGERGRQPFFYKANRFKDDATRLNLGNGMVLDKSTSTLHLGQQKVPLKRFVISSYDKSGKLNKKIQTINPNAQISIIFMQSYNSFLVLDESMYNSLFIQMFVLENYDKDLFELVISHPLAKVYKLKK